MKGFTLIEVLVSVAIFSIVMVIALGALLAMSVSDRKAETLKSVINNLNFAVDSMSRSIRTGYDYHCGSVAGGDCAGTGSNTFYYTAACPSGAVCPGGGILTGYRLENVASDPAGAGSVCHQTASIGCIARSTDGGSTWSALTSPEISISDFSPNGYLFYVIGSARGSPDNVQPKVIITLSGYVQLTATATSTLHLQTTVTQRLYDQ